MELGISRGICKQVLSEASSHSSIQEEEATYPSKTELRLGYLKSLNSFQTFIISTFPTKFNLLFNKTKQ